VRNWVTQHCYVRTYAFTNIAIKKHQRYTTMTIDIFTFKFHDRSQQYYVVSDQEINDFRLRRDKFTIRPKRQGEGIVDNFKALSSKADNNKSTMASTHSRTSNLPNSRHEQLHGRQASLKKINGSFRTMRACGPGVGGKNLERSSSLSSKCSSSSHDKMNSSKSSLVSISSHHTRNLTRQSSKKDTTSTAAAIADSRQRDDDDDDDDDDEKHEDNEHYDEFGGDDNDSCAYMSSVADDVDFDIDDYPCYDDSGMDMDMEMDLAIGDSIHHAKARSRVEP
jgi:hypothetical protein